MTVVGWYVHHHGAGHLTRFLAVRPHLDADVAVVSSLPAPRALPPRTTWTPLPRDDDAVTLPDDSVRLPEDSSPTANGVLHWAPVGHPGHTARLAAISSLIAETKPSAFVIDVSVEVALFVRLLGVPVVVVTQPGDRSDDPHRLAYSVADRILAPWPVGVYGSAALAAVADKVRFVGGISRFDGRRTGPIEPRTVVVLAGAADPGAAHPGAADPGPGEARSGCTPSPAERVASAAAATPSWTWSVIGATAATRLADPADALGRAEIVVAPAGQNGIADLAALGSRAVVIPQERPFDEQGATGRALEAAGLAVTVPEWPGAGEWPDVLDRALRLEPEWSRWHVAGAAERAADVIAEVAAWQ